MSYLESKFIRAGDPTHSKAQRQLGVTINGAVDYDTSHDWYAKAKQDSDGFVFPMGKRDSKEASGVVTGELTFRKRRHDNLGESGNKKRKRTRMHLDSKLTPLLSNLACIPVNYSKEEYDLLEKEEKKELIYKQIKFAGMAATPSEEMIEGKQFGREDFANLIGGVDSIINTGDKPILAGQVFVYGVPDPVEGDNENDFYNKLKQIQRIQGTDKNKVLLTTEPYDPENIIRYDSFITVLTGMKNKVADFYTTFANIITDPKLREKKYDISTLKNFIWNLLYFLWVMKGFTATTTTTAAIVADAKSNTFTDAVDQIVKDLLEKKEPLMRMINAFYKSNHAYNSRVAGVALSDALPTHQFDVHLGAPYCLST